MTIGLIVEKWHEFPEHVLTAEQVQIADGVMDVCQAIKDYEPWKDAQMIILAAQEGYLIPVDIAIYFFLPSSAQMGRGMMANYRMPFVQEAHCFTGLCPTPILEFLKAP